MGVVPPVAGELYWRARRDRNRGTPILTSARPNLMEYLEKDLDIDEDTAYSPLWLRTREFRGAMGSGLSCVTSRQVKWC
jgi:hypothetical protein